MRKIFLVSFCFLLILIIGSISNRVFAGYDESMENKKIEKNLLYTEVVEYSEKIKDDNILDNQTIIKIPYDEIKNVDLDFLKLIMDKKGVGILVEYTTFEELLNATNNVKIDLQSIREMLDRENEFIGQYDNNGYIDLRLEDDNQLYFGGFFTKAQKNDVLLKNYNMFKGNIVYEMAEGTEKIKEKSNKGTKSLGNYELRFYWSSSTSYNKVYQSASTSSSIIVNLYRSEMLQNLVTESERTYNDSYGGTYYENFVKVQANNSSGNITQGWYLRHRTYNPNNGDEGWGGDDNWYNYCKTLRDMLQSAYNSNYQSAQTGGHVYYSNGYYGVRIKTATSRYNSSGSYIGSAPVNSIVWVNNSNMCGYSHPEYMSIHGYSASSGSSMTTYGSTTFVDAGLLTSNPSNYRIDVRWW